MWAEVVAGRRRMGAARGGREPLRREIGCGRGHPRRVGRGGVYRGAADAAEQRAAPSGGSPATLRETT